MTTRREFVVRLAGLGAALSLPELILADPYRPLELPRRAVGPIRVRGRVVAGTRVVPGARVSDGRTVVKVDGNGRFDFVTTETQRHLSVCPPPDYALPTNPTGTLKLHVPISAAPGGEMLHEFSLVARPGSDDRHTVLVLADPQTANDYEMKRFHAETVPDVVTTRAGLGDQTVFGVGCGDLMWDHPELYPEYERAVSRMGIPFAQLVGNHDLDQASRTAEGSTATFERYFGPPHYSFDVGQLHYQVLHDVFWHGAGYLGYLTGEQLDWIRNDLAAIETGKTVVVFLHIPVLSSQYERLGQRDPAIGISLTNRDALYRLLEGRTAHVIAGHTHESEHRTQGRIHEHVTGAVCGAWWSGDICFDGTPNGYSVYEVNGDRITSRYKSTGRDASHQLRLYRPGADKSAPGDFVANVWDWNPDWTVQWFEDGQPRGLMTRRRGLDPLSVEQQLGDKLPPRQPWVEPMITNHLFYGAASPGAKEWRVEAKDGAGRTYTEVLRAG